MPGARLGASDLWWKLLAFCPHRVHGQNGANFYLEFLFAGSYKLVRIGICCAYKVLLHILFH